MAQIIKPLYTPRYVPSGEEMAVIDTNKGTIRVQLKGSDAPATVGNFVELACKGFYDGLNFHGRKEGDVVVGGCPITRALRPQQVRMAVREQLRGIHPGVGDPGYVITLRVRLRSPIRRNPTAAAASFSSRLPTIPNTTTNSPCSETSSRGSTWCML